MKNLIDLRIELNEAGLESDPFSLRNLERDIQREVPNQISHETRTSPEGTMGGDIVIALELAGLAVSALNAIWTILLVRYKYQMSFEKELADGTKITITQTSLTKKQLEQEMEEHEKEAKEKKLKKFIIKLGGKT
jgi:hypothetical protein